MNSRQPGFRVCHIIMSTQSALLTRLHCQGVHVGKQDLNQTSHDVMLDSQALVLVFRNVKILQDKIWCRTIACWLAAQQHDQGLSAKISLLLNSHTNFGKFCWSQIWYILCLFCGQVCKMITLVVKPSCYCKYPSNLKVCKSALSFVLYGKTR